MYIVICLSCFIFGLFIENILVSSMINGKISFKYSKLKFKTKDSKEQYLFGPSDKHDFAALIYSLNTDIYGEVISEIDKEN